MVAEMNQLATRQYVSPFGVAIVYTALGVKDHAFEWIEKAGEDQSSLMGLLQFDARIDSLRSDRRFADLVRRAGL
jgi:hypothetical protein